MFLQIQTFSCKGLFTTLTTENGTLTISLPGSDTRTETQPSDYVEFYKVSILSETTKEVVVSETMLFEDMNIYMDIQSGIITCDGSVLEKGKLPILTKNGFTFNGWFLNNAVLTELPDTSAGNAISLNASSEYVFPIGTGIYYVTQNGTGDGSSPKTPLAIADLNTTTMTGYTGEGNHNNLPRVYLLDTFDLEYGITFRIDAEVIGIDRTNGYESVHIRSNDPNATPILTITDGFTCYFENVYIEGDDQHQGIANSGNLTLNRCCIRDCHTNDFGGGIYGRGTDLYMKGCTISGCSVTNGRGGGL